MKYVDGMLVDDIVSNFEQITVYIKTKQQMFVVVAGKRTVVDEFFDGRPNVSFGYVMSERCMVKLNLRIHTV
jgi:hypothetical protein